MHMLIDFVLVVHSNTCTYIHTYIHTYCRHDYKCVYGPACEAVGLTKYTLLAALVATLNFSHKLACVTNELVIELLKNSEYSNVPCDVLKAWVANLSPETSSAQQQHTFMTV